MKKILVCEDEPGLNKLLKIRFQEDGWEVTSVMDGQSAIDLIKKERYDLVLLDLMMPVKNGFDVLQDIKANPAFRDLPIIVMSGLESDEDIKKALKLGATDYYVKSQHPIGEVLEKAKAYGDSSHPVQ
jgi:two-component system alkaline phosphatase synthesis response regulator PhoP